MAPRHVVHYASPKYAFFSWLACHNRLSTKDRISSWNTNMRTECGLCGVQVESCNHLFFLCLFSTQVWEALMGNLFSVDFFTDWEQVVNLLYNSIFDKVKLFLLRYAFQVVVYHIWR